MDYLPLLISCSTTGGAFSESLQYGEIFDTKERFGLWIQHSPFTITPAPKNILTQEWKDEDGEDVFIPSNIVHSAYDMELTFVYLRNDGQAVNNITAFIDTIKGKWLKIYDSYIQQGRQGIYMIECDSQPTFKRRNNYNLAIFTCKFKVNDPDTNITL